MTNGDDLAGLVCPLPLAHDETIVDETVDAVGGALEEAFA